MAMYVGHQALSSSDRKLAMMIHVVLRDITGVIVVLLCTLVWKVDSDLTRAKLFQWQMVKDAR